jgi:predicted permease
MLLIARWIIRLSALLAPRTERARLREEWLAELDAVSARGRLSALRFAIGAPADARARRSAGRDDDGTTPERGRLFSAVGGDVKYAWRQLVRRPSHSLAVVACLVAGLFVCIGTISVFESMLTGDQPGVHDRKALMRLYLSYESVEPPDAAVRPHRTGALNADEFALLRVNELPPNSALTAIGVEGVMPMSLTGNHGPITARGAFVSGDYFKVLDTQRGPAGRLLDRSHDAAGPAVAVVSEHFWRAQLDASPDAIGRPILITGISVTVIGVAPTRFHGMLSDDVGDDDSRGTQVWMPLSMASRWAVPADAQALRLATYGRLKAGRTHEEAEAGLSLASRRIADTFPERRGKAALLVRPEAIPIDTTPVRLAAGLTMVMVLPLTILAIGCANVANLQLARVAERSRELAVRLSLGASRGQLIRLLTLETLARAIAAAGIAIGLIVVAIRYVQPYFPVFLSVNWRAAAFAIALALAVALGTGLMPAWMVLRKTSAGQLKQSAQSGGLGHTRMRAALIITQVALSLCLLVSTGHIVSSIQRMQAMAPPALLEQVVASFNTAAIGMTPDEARRFADTLVERVSHDGRVRRAALSESTSASFGARQENANGTVRMQPAQFLGISSSWLDVMDVKVLTGRALNDRDDDHAVLLSANAAEMASPAGAALGMVLTLQTGPTTTREARVVGIVADTPTEPSMGRPAPVVYTVLPKTFRREFVFRARTTGTQAVSADLLTLIRAIDSRVSWTSIRRGDMNFEDESREMTMMAIAVASCGTIALILSATGLFAVMSYVVTLRRREIGVRLAIGAEPSRIVALVIRQAVTLVATGVTVGLAIGIPLAFLMRSEFLGSIEPADPAVYAPALGVLFVVGAVAAAVPAFRASRVDPISTLRQE